MVQQDTCLWGALKVISINDSHKSVISGANVMSIAPLRTLITIISRRKSGADVVFLHYRRICHCNPNKRALTTSVDLVINARSNRAPEHSRAATEETNHYFIIAL